MSLSPGGFERPPHQLRVIEEKEQLDERLVKLLAFFKAELFGRLPVEEQVRLRAQASYMTAYSNVLGERIAAFPFPS